MSVSVIEGYSCLLTRVVMKNTVMFLFYVDILVGKNGQKCNIAGRW